MKTALNTILRGLMRRNDVIGKVYTGTKLVETVPPSTSTAVSSVMVPPGVYVITANMEWTISTPAFALIHLGTQNGTLAIERGNMEAGGGGSISAVANCSNNTQLKVSLYHSHTTSVGFWANLQAIRIK